jgi:hypothetical protein
MYTASTCLFAVARKVKVSDTIDNVKAGEDSGQGLEEFLVLNFRLQNTKMIHD